MASSGNEKFRVPVVIKDIKTGVTFKKINYLGKGNMSKYYRVADLNTNYKYAAKVISKKLITMEKNVQQEVTIHRKLEHINIVRLFWSFEDNNYSYTVLEFCTHNSLAELSLRRGPLLQGEVRYYMRQILYGLLYLHENHIIHRNLKLSNILLDNKMCAKITDFRKAVEMKNYIRKRLTVVETDTCLTPEILNKKEYGYEVDVWAVGCIMYTLLIGAAPFESYSLKDTFSKIQLCKYEIPSSAQISNQATKMIMDILQPNPEHRPSVRHLLNSEFFMSVYIPRRLDYSCLVVAPRISKLEKPLDRIPLLNLGTNSPPTRVPPTCLSFSPASTQLPHISSLENDYNHLCKLKDEITALMMAISDKEMKELSVESSNPEAFPIFWISRWTRKCGFGYEFCDGSIGVVCSDSTKIVLHSNRRNIQYITREGKEYYYTVERFPHVLNRKVEMLCYFRRCFRCAKSSRPVASEPVNERDSLCRLPYVSQEFHFTSSTMMLLSTGTLQVNFVNHNKIIICPHMPAVTFVDSQWRMISYTFKSIKQSGCHKSLICALEYALHKVKITVEDYMTNKRIKSHSGSTS